MSKKLNLLLGGIIGLIVGVVGTNLAMESKFKQLEDQNSQLTSRLSNSEATLKKLRGNSRLSSPAITGQHLARQNTGSTNSVVTNTAQVRPTGSLPSQRPTTSRQKWGSELEPTDEMLAARIAREQALRGDASQDMQLSADSM
jgi:hypothetical protein